MVRVVTCEIHPEKGGPGLFSAILWANHGFLTKWKQPSNMLLLAWLISSTRWDPRHERETGTSLLRHKHNIIKRLNLYTPKQSNTDPREEHTNTKQIDVFKENSGTKAGHQRRAEQQLEPGFLCELPVCEPKHLEGSFLSVGGNENNPVTCKLASWASILSSAP